MSKLPKTASRSSYVTSTMSGERVQAFVPALSLPLVAPSTWPLCRASSLWNPTASYGIACSSMRSI